MTMGRDTLELQDVKRNGKGELMATVVLIRNGEWILVDRVNLSKDKERRSLANRLSQEFQLDQAETELLRLTQPAREELENASTDESDLRQYVPGFVLPDGTTGELVLDPETQERAFVVKSPDGKIRKSDSWDGPGGTVFSPPNDKLVDTTVLFPSEPVTYEDVATLPTAVRDFIHRYLELPKDYEILAGLYVLMTWVFDVLPVVPYLRARGDFGTGRSRFLQVIGIICYRAIFASGATTPSPVFRILDRYPGTLVMDEADFKLSEAWAEIVKILNQGYKPGTPVLRSEKVGQGRFEPESFAVFGPKIIASRQKFKYEALESRCLSPNPPMDRDGGREGSGRG